MRRDIIICFLIAITALSLRLPFISEPKETVLDEGYFATFIKYTNNGQPFFEGHPPLGWYMPSLFVSQNESASWEKYPSAPGTPFNNFPYERLRIINAILGSMVAVLAYILLRLFNIDPIIAVVPSILLSFDDSLLIFSRIMLPQIHLLFFGMLGMVLCVAATNFHGRKRAVFMYGGAIFIGLATAVKLTGLGFAIPVIVWLLMNKMAKKVAPFLLAVFFTYLAMFVLYTANFAPGPVDSSLGYIKTAPTDNLIFPKKSDINGQIDFFSAYNHDIFVFHNEYGKFLNQFADPDASSYDSVNPGSAWLWPVSVNRMSVWSGHETDQHIILKGNRLVWILAMIGAIYGLYRLLIIAHLSKDLLSGSKWKEIGKIIYKDRLTVLLMAGYLGNFIPFFVISRPMYIYSYLSALIFGLLMATKMIYDIRNSVSPRLFRIFYMTTFATMAGYFILDINTIYGL